MNDSLKNDGSDDDKNEPKLVVDTDWKEQVAREKEADLAAETDSAEQPVSDTTTDSESQTDSEAQVNVEPVSVEPHVGAESDIPSDAGQPNQPPPASFEVMISMLFTQAMAMLGQMPDPATGKTTVNKPFAKHYIDTLDMLSEKTEGNLSDDEKKMLSEALHALRMMYVGSKNA